MLKLSKRIHPDFRTCALPKLVKPNSAFTFTGAIPAGIVPHMVNDPWGDPDVPVAPSKDLYVWPRRFPGLLLKSVSGMEELFRLGSNFLMVETVSNFKPIVGLVGAKAEHALLTGRIPVQVDNMPGSLLARSSAMATTVGNVGGTWAPEDAGVLTGSGYVTAAQSAAATLSVFDMVPADSRSSASMYYNPGLGYVDIASAAFLPVNSEGKIRIFAIVTEAEMGELYSLKGPQGEGVANPSRRSGIPTGWLANSFEVATVGQIASHHFPAYIADVPSDARKYVEKAHSLELLASGSQVLHQAYGIAFYNTGLGGANPTGALVDFGLMVPASGTGADEEFQPGNLDVNSTSCCPMATIPWSSYEIKKKAVDHIVASFLWATLISRERNATEVTHEPSARYAALPAYTVNGLIAARAEQYEKEWEVDRVVADQATKTVTVNAGTPAQQQVKTLEQDTLLGNRHTAHVYSNPLTYGPQYYMRRFYRRVAKRAEKLAKSG